MFSPQFCFFLYFINCGFVAVTPNQSNDRKMDVDKFDTIEVEEESCQEDRRRRRGSRQKCKNGKNYDANETQTRRRRWFRSNKIAPIVLPTAEEGPSGEGPSGTQGQQYGSKPEIFDDKPMQASDDHVVIDFCETEDSFLQRQNSGLALQSFATCARLNENFMRKAAWTTKEVSDSGALDNDKASASSASFPSKVSSAWKVFRRSISRRDSIVSAQGEPGTSGGNTSEARETTEDPIDSKNSQTQFRRKSKQGNSSKTTSSKPVHGIQELGGDDSTFDRDLYMQINNLAVTHDTGQFALRDPFLIQEDIPTLSEIPIDYLTTVLEDEDLSRKSQSNKKSRWSGFLARVKRRKN